MNDTTDKTTKKTTLTLGSKLGSSKLNLSSIEPGKISQTIAGGRKRGVTVEVVRKKRRPSDFKPGSGSASTDGARSNVVKNAKEIPVDLGGLTESERASRLKVLERASKDEEARAILKTEAEAEAEEKSKISKQLADESTKKDAENVEAAKDKAVKDAPKTASAPAEESDSKLVKPIKSNDRLSSFPATKSKKDDKKHEKTTKNRMDNKRRSNKLTINQALSGGEERTRSLASIRRAREKAKRAAAGDTNREKEKVVREVVLPEVITVQELANRMAERVVDVTKSLMKMGMMVTANQSIDADTAEIVVEEFGHNMRRVTDADVEDILKDTMPENESDLLPRAPVVTFMGHVDHGKTSLLDAIRKAKVASGEAGGITQHIGAYQVSISKNNKITFLDTPGHEAFTAMRQRGASATDIVVLVVAADDGIMAQTVEAINHAKAAEVPIIIAINKIDKPASNPQAVRTALLSHELVTEDMGGDVLAIEVSAKTGKNLDKLLDAIILQSEILELKANPNRPASGIVVESRIDKTRGVVSTLLVQKGTLKIGDITIVGQATGKVRAMKSEGGRTMAKAGPSVPVEILGLDEAPESGVEFHVVESDKQAREIKEYRQKRSRDLRTAMQQKKGSLENLFLQASGGGKKMLPILIKGDVQGSVEAIISSLDKIETDEVGVKVLHSAVGGITTSDITLAGASGAIILAFNVRADTAAKELSLSEHSDIRYYSIIYDLIDDVKAILGGMLDPHIREQFIGSAEIRDVFNITKSGKVAGCYVTDGNIKRGSGVRLLRDNVVIHEGKLKTLKRFKEDVKEVAANFECGMAFENYEDIKTGDIIEAFELIEEKRTL